MLGWKKMWNQTWRPRNSCDNGSMAKILIAKIQVNLCVLLQVSLGLGTKFTWIAIIKIFVIELSPQPFLGCHVWFHIFYHSSCTLFSQFGCFCIRRYHFFLYWHSHNTPKLAYASLLFFFLYYRSEALLWKRCCIQNLTFFFICIISITVLYLVLKLVRWL